jgi:hypothetical protein
VAITLQRPGDAPSWFTFFFDGLLRQLTRSDQETVKFIRRDVTYADDGTTVNVGTLPANALILRELSGVEVHEVFNAGTNNFLDIGTTADADYFATDLALGSVGLKKFDEAVSLRMSVATGITASVDLTGTAATTGQASIVIAYVTLPKEA